MTRTTAAIASLRGTAPSPLATGVAARQSAQGELGNVIGEALGEATRVLVHLPDTQGRGHGEAVEQRLSHDAEGALLDLRRIEIRGEMRDDGFRLTQHRQNEFVDDDRQ